MPAASSHFKVNWRCADKTMNTVLCMRGVISSTWWWFLCIYGNVHWFILLLSVCFLWNVSLYQHQWSSLLAGIWAVTKKPHLSPEDLEASDDWIFLSFSFSFHECLAVFRLWKPKYRVFLFYLTVRVLVRHCLVRGIQRSSDSPPGWQPFQHVHRDHATGFIAQGGWAQQSSCSWVQDFVKERWHG